MHHTIHRRASSFLAALVVLAVSVAGCGLESQKAPSLTGPSEFALSVTLSATPDQLPRDGSSRSTVTVTVRDASGRPVSGQRLAVATSVGTPSVNEVVTGPNGQATFTVLAPGAASVGNTLLVQVVPVGGNFDNAAVRSVSILITGALNSTAPTAAFTTNPVAPVLQEPVVLDATSSTDEGVSCRDLCTYSWDFGGEAGASGRVVTYRFQAVRTYPVRLTVTDSAGSTSTLTQNVIVAQGTAPTVSFTFSPTSPGQFQTVNFTAEASRPGVPGRTITSYQWRFGDGAAASGMTATHAYSVLGTYPVTLTVTDSAGVQTTVSQSVTVINGVTASFTVSPLPTTVGRDTIFDAEGSQGSDSGFGGRNPIKEYIWNFGDSTGLTSENDRLTSHVYTTTGDYTATLTVVDSANRRATTTRTVAVR